MGSKAADKSDCADTYSCATGPEAWNKECVPTKACTEKVDNVQATCAKPTPSGTSCDSTKADSGCATGEQCATGPKASMNTCVKDAVCGTGDGDDKITCGDGFRCATAPDALKNRCVTKEACDQKVGDVTTTCGAKALAASLIAAF